MGRYSRTDIADVSFYASPARLTGRLRHRHDLWRLGRCSPTCQRTSSFRTGGGALPTGSYRTNRTEMGDHQWRGWRFIGITGLSRKWGRRGLNLEYYLARDQWGRGIATEAGSIKTTYAINLAGADRVTASFFADNPASGRVLSKIGFIRRGRSHAPHCATGTVKPPITMRLAPSSGQTHRKEAFCWMKRLTALLKVRFPGSDRLPRAPRWRLFKGMLDKSHCRCGRRSGFEQLLRC